MDNTKLQEDCLNGLSISDIASKYGLSKTNIRYWLKKFNLKTIKKKASLSENESLTMNEKRWGNIKSVNDYDWIEIQKFYNDGYSWRDIISYFKISNHIIAQAKKLGLFSTNKMHRSLTPKKVKSKKIVSDATKKKISEKRKEYLKNNPDKHPWKHSRFVSPPCERVKQKFKEYGLIFKEEETPFAKFGKFYSCDICFPDIKLAIEINGEQHYNRDRTLKKYYQSRHDYFLSHGWNIIEVHYSLAYDDEYIYKLAQSAGFEPTKT